MNKTSTLLIFLSYFSGALSEPGMVKTPDAQRTATNQTATARIEKARLGYLKARNTFAGELLIVKKLQDPSLDESQYLRAYLDLMELVLNRFKKERYHFSFSNVISYVNLLLWGRNTLRIPLTHYMKLADSTLSDLATYKISVLQAKRTIELESKDREQAEELYQDIIMLENNINEIKTLAQNNQYELEQKETRDFMMTYVGTTCILLTVGIAYGMALKMMFPVPSQPAGYPRYVI